MIKMLKTAIHAIWVAIQVIWVISVLTLGTAFGAVYGWEHHGWAGAIMLGFVGLCVGALIAAAPILEFMD